VLRSHPLPPRPPATSCPAPLASRSRRGAARQRKVPPNVCEGRSPRTEKSDVAGARGRRGAGLRDARVDEVIRFEGRKIQPARRRRSEVSPDLRVRDLPILAPLDIRDPERRGRCDRLRHATARDPVVVALPEPRYDRCAAERLDGASPGTAGNDVRAVDLHRAHGPGGDNEAAEAQFAIAMWLVQAHHEHENVAGPRWLRSRPDESLGIQPRSNGVVTLKHDETHRRRVALCLRKRVGAQPDRLSLGVDRDRRE
jgi:hypothetical protein